MKIFDRWPIEKNYPELFDTACDQDEQLPRLIRMELYEKTIGENVYVYQRCNGIKVGDCRLSHIFAIRDI